MPGVSGRSGRRRWIGAAVVVTSLASGPALAAVAAPPPAAGSGAPAPPPTAGSCVARSAWPEYQGDPTHAADACSRLDASNVGRLRPAWFFATTGAVTDTPAVAFGSVFAGDYSGAFHALDQRTGTERWSFDTTAPHRCFLDAAVPHADTHVTGFGQIPASPAAAVIAGRRLVFVAAGGSLFALDAASGRCVWAQDTDPGKPSSSIEIESSPVVDTAVAPAEVIVGNDDNSGPGVGVTGLMAFDAATGSLLWKYEPERDLTLEPSQFGGSDALTLSCGEGSPDPYCNPAHIAGLAPNQVSFADACGDVWSSPALDTAFADPGGDNSYQGSGGTPAGWFPKQITRTGGANPPARPDGLVVFGTGNCAANPDPATARAHGVYVDNQGIFALDPVTGVRVWDFVEPYNRYDSNPAEPGGGDDDFGSSALIARLPATSVPAASCPADVLPQSPTPSTTLVIEGSKDGTAYGICAATGKEVWAVQAAQPGQLSPGLVGSVGGFIGSPSLGLSNGRPTVFFTSAVPIPLSNDGIRLPGGAGDTNIAPCPGMAPVPLPPACPDVSSAKDPGRYASLHAVDAATGRIVFQAPSLPTYAASSYTNGVVFMPDSLASGVAAFDADTGDPIWAFPLGAVPASAAAIAGHSIYLGTGETDSAVSGETVPPQMTGIWKFSTGGAQVVATPPGSP